MFTYCAHSARMLSKCFIMLNYLTQTLLINLKIIAFVCTLNSRKKNREHWQSFFTKVTKLKALCVKCIYVLCKLTFNL